MADHAKRLLARWWSIENGDGFQRATRLVRVLSILEIAVTALLVIGFVRQWHPVAVAAGAAVLGWVVSERNALETRMAQWPIARKYIDWDRVGRDLGARPRSAD